MAGDLLPSDPADTQLRERVHPPDWVNPRPARRYALVVVGAGTAGLVTTAAAASLGARVAIVERAFMGGDCLVTGCVPSKALLRSARAVHDVRSAARFGIEAAPPHADFAAVMARMRGLRVRLSGADSARRFRELGADVFFGNARFTGPDSLVVDGTELRFRRAVIATGSRPAVPDVPGLREFGFLTSENVFNLTERPRRLVVVGGGPIGVELAQAFARLGSEVTLVHRGPRLLPRDEEEASAIVAAALARDGVQLRLSRTVARVERDGDAARVVLASGPVGKTESTNAEEIPADAILVATGRTVDTRELNPGAAGVEVDERGRPRVDDYLRTTHPRIFAAGDVCLSERYTHAADFSARIVVRNALFRGRRRCSGLLIPHCTYTDPEVAQVGLTPAQARERGVRVDSFTTPFADVDRAVLDGEDEGFVRIHVRKGTDTIVGATIVGRHAGELINEVTLAMMHGIGLAKLAEVVHPYPTAADAIRRTGDAWNRTRLTKVARFVLGIWLRFG